MDRPLDRRRLLTSAAAVMAMAGLNIACSTGRRGEDTARDTAAAPTTAGAGASVDAYPVTIAHHFGRTTLEQRPTRIATLGPNDADNLVALGVVPIGVPKISYGGNARGSTPWFDVKLVEMGVDLPTLYDTTDSVPVDDIAALAPDVILATNYSLTQAQYDQLSKIAPVVAYPGAPWVTTWQDTLALCGRAVGLSTAAASLTTDTEAVLTAARQQFPELIDKTFIFGALTTSDMSSISYYTPQDQRPEFLVSLGMVNAPVIEQISKQGQFYGTISAERAPELVSDVFVTYGEEAGDEATFAADTLVGQIPALKGGHTLVITDKTIGLAVSVPTPLSIPYTMQNFVPGLERAARGA